MTKIKQTQKKAATNIKSSKVKMNKFKFLRI